MAACFSKTVGKVSYQAPLDILLGEDTYMKWCTALHLRHILLVRRKSQSSHTKGDNHNRVWNRRWESWDHPIHCPPQAIKFPGWCSSSFSPRSLAALQDGRWYGRNKDGITLDPQITTWTGVALESHLIHSGFLVSKKFEMFYHLTFKKKREKKSLTWPMKEKKKKKDMGD